MNLYTRLLLFFIPISVGSVLLTSILGYTIFQQGNTKDVHQKLIRKAQSEQHHIESNLDHYFNLLKLIAHQNTLHEALQRQHASPQNQSLQQLQGFIQHQNPFLPEGSRLILLDSTSKVLANSAEQPFKPDDPLLNWLLVFTETGAMAPQVVVDENKHIWLTHPFQPALHKQPYFLMMLLNETDLARSPLRYEFDDSGLDVTLLTHDLSGKPLTLLANQDRFQTNPAENHNNQRKPSRFQFLVPDHVEFKAVPALQQVPVFSVAYPIEHTEWQLVVTYAKQDAFDKVFDLMILQSLLVVGLLFVVILTTLYLAKLISSPIAQLSGQAVKIQQGDHEFPDIGSGIQEIRQLNNAFQHMANTLISSNKTLEMRVGQRTEELLQGKAHLQLITDNIPALVAHVDEQNRYRFVNQPFCDAIGVNRGDILGKKLDAVNSPFEFSEAQPHLEQVLQGVSVSFETQREDAKAGRQFFQISLVPGWFQGQVEGFFLLGTEITQRKQMELALQRNEFRLGSILNAVDDTIITLNQRGLIDSCNIYGLNLLKTQPETIQGTQLDQWLSMDSPDPSTEAFFEYVQGTFSIQFGSYSDAVIQLYDHTSFPAHVSITFAMVELEPLYVVLIHDMTERKHLEITRRRLTEIIEATTDYIGTMDTQGNLHYMNRSLSSLIAKISPPDELHFNLLRFFAETGQREVIELGLQQAAQQGNWIVESALIQSGQGSIPVSMVLIAHQDSRHESKLFSLIARDISSLKQIQLDLTKAKEEAEQANRAKSDFLASMSHEIRTPLNAVLGMAELLKDSALNPQQTQLVHSIISGGDTLLGLVNDILDLAKIEARKLVIESTVLNLPTLIRDLAELFSHKAGEKSLQIRWKLDKAVPVLVKGDPTRLRQILMNLVSNAVKFTQQGWVEISVERLAQVEQEIISLKFNVEDTGMGIPKEQHSLLFKPFTQMDASITRKYGGTGLGLSICRELLDLMGGRISVVSEPGQGSCFSFELELALPEAGEITQFEQQSATVSALAAEPNASFGQASPKPTGNRHILIAEDTPDNQMILQAFLEKQAHRVTLARNGREVLDFFERQSFDLVLMDMQMPILDGYQATRALREYEVTHERARTPVIAVTAYSLQEELQKCLEAGCDDYITKPIRPAILYAKLSHYLEGKARISNPEPPIQQAPQLGSTSIYEIKLPPELASIANQLMAIKVRQVQELDQAWEARNWQELETLGHRIKGSQGFPQFRELGRKIEQSAQLKDDVSLEQLIQSVQDYIQKVRLV